MINKSRLKISKLRGLILDMDGVLWRGIAPIGDLAANFERITNLGLRVIMATNNATRTPAQYIDKLSGFGVSIKPWQIINSAMATVFHLKNRFPQGGNVFVIGEDALIRTLESGGFLHTDVDPLAVVAAMDRGINYENLSKAALFIQKGVLFIGTNPDKSFPIPEGQAPGAGAILAALEATTGISPLIMGKPQPEMYNLALERLGTSPDETLVVGDRLETDIAGAYTTHCSSALVLSGVTSKTAAHRWLPSPDIIAEDLAAVLDVIELDQK